MGACSSSLRATSCATPWTASLRRLANVPTLRFPRLEDLSPEDCLILERVAKRRGTTVERLSEIWKAQAHWPALLEANLAESAQAFMQVGRLPVLTKQAMHVAVSMANACDF